MTDTAVGVGARRRSVRILAVPEARRLDGERLAVATTAAAIAMLPLAVPTGPGNTAPADAFLAVAVAATLLWAGTSGHRWRLPYVIAASVFIAGGALGALAGPVPMAGIVALGQDLVLLAWCWSVVNISCSPRNLKILLVTWVYSAIGWTILLFVGLESGISVLTGQIERQGSRVAITLGDPNYAANYLFISIMIMWATGHPRNRGLRFAAYALVLTAIALTGSNSGLVSLVLGVVVAALVGIHRRFGMVPAITTLAFLVLGGYLVAANISAKGIQEAAADSRYAFVRDGIGRSGSEASYRELLLRQSMHLYETGGPVGTGPVSTKVRLQNQAAPYVKEAHDDYVASLIERGALGFLGLLLLVFSVGLRTLSAGRARPAVGFGAVVTRPNALIGAVVGTLVVGTVYELFHVRHVWTLFAFVAAVSIWSRE